VEVDLHSHAPDQHWSEEERTHDRRAIFTRFGFACTTLHAHLREGASRSSLHRRHVFIATKIHGALVKDRLIDAAVRPAGL
jgi:hypothetical protein